MQVLEKKIEVLTKARAADVKKSKKSELALVADIRKWQDKFEDAIASSKVTLHIPSLTADDVVHTGA